MCVEILVNLPIWSIAIDDGLKCLAAGGSSDSSVLLWNLIYNSVPPSALNLSDHESLISGVFIVSNSKGKRLLVSGDLGDCIKVWDIELKQCIWELSGDILWAGSLSTSKDSLGIVFEGNKRLTLWSLDKKKKILDFDEHADFTKIDLCAVFEYYSIIVLSTFSTRKVLGTIQFWLIDDTNSHLVHHIIEKQEKNAVRFLHMPQ